MRVIVDAHVAIAAAASRGLCEAVLELCLEHHRLILCEGAWIMTTRSFWESNRKGK